MSNFYDIRGIHHTIQKIKCSSVKTELKEEILNHYNDLLSNLNIFGKVCSNIHKHLNATAIDDSFKELSISHENIENCTLNIQRCIEQIKKETNKFNKLAVIFVGHYRTFKTCLPHNLFFFNRLSKNVDYYFITWNNTDYDTSDYQRDDLMPNRSIDFDLDIKIYFGNLLKGIKIINSEFIQFDRIDINNRGLLKLIHLTYLSKIGNILKQSYEKEHGFVYDQVIETRPDIVHYPDTYNHSNFFFYCNKNDLVTDFCKYNLTPESNNLIGNWYWRMNSETHNRFAGIHDFLINESTTEFVTFHSGLNNYFMKNHYNIHKGLDSLRTVHVKTPDDLTPI